MTEAHVFIAQSLDGFIATPTGGLEWLARVSRPGEDHGYADFMARVDALLLGRATHDVVSAFPEWPYAGKRVYVATRRPRATPNGEIVVAGSPDAMLARLAADGVRRVYVDGGQLVSSFLAAGRVDELIVSVVPVLLGDGIPLFRATGERGLVLRGATTFASGLVQLRYGLEVDRP
jgi:dihydrofolate reductase